jgi:hypothetical protein
VNWSVRKKINLKIIICKAGREWECHYGNSSKVKDCFSNDIKNNVYIVLQICLGCTCGSTFIYFNVLYPKCLIDSLAKVNSFKPIMGLCVLIIILKIKMNYKGLFFPFNN